jgi:hypothetical protein
VSQTRTFCPPPNETPAGTARNSPRLWCRFFSVKRSWQAPNRSTSCITPAASLTASFHIGSSGWPTRTAIIRFSLSNINRVLLQHAVSEAYRAEAIDSPAIPLDKSEVFLDKILHSPWPFPDSFFTQSHPRSRPGCRKTLHICRDL